MGLFRGNKLFSKQQLFYELERGENMKDITKNDLAVLEELLNEEILSYLDSGYNLKDDYVISLRNLIKRLDLKEYYNFDKGYKNER